MQKKVQYLTGDFEGYFYTNQKVTLGQTDHLPTDGSHKMVLYKGELKNIGIESAFDPQNVASRDNVCLNNIANIQLNNAVDKKLVFDKKIESFEFVVLDNIKIENSWELNDKTYGLLRATLRGKLQSIASVDVPDDAEIVPTRPPIDPGNKTVKPLEPAPAPKPTPIPIPIAPTPPTPPPGPGGSEEGCWKWFWKILLWLMILFFIIFLFKQCNYLNNWFSDNKCCDDSDRLLIENNKLRTSIDSLRERHKRENNENRIKWKRESIQEELNRQVNSIYFKGNSTEPRTDPEFVIMQIVKIMRAYPIIELEIQGRQNSDINKDRIDVARANVIRNLILDKGIDPSRITAVGLGSSYVDPNDKYDSAYDQNGKLFKYNSNMRVDIKITKY